MKFLLTLYQPLEKSTAALELILISKMFLKRWKNTHNKPLSN